VLNLAIANFLMATLIGSLVWSAPLLALGYSLQGRSADAASSGLLVITALVALEFLLFAAWRTIRHSRKRR
jgi:alkaline phosphatase